MEDDEIRIAIDEDADADPEAAVAAGPSRQVAVLSLLILVLLGLMLGLVGAQAIETERRFFQTMTLNVNREIADLVAQQAVQVFTAATGLVQDLAAFPEVRRSVGASLVATASTARDTDVEALFEVVVRRNKAVRAVLARDAAGRVLARQSGVNVPAPPALPAGQARVLLDGAVPGVHAAPYKAADGQLCVGYGRGVLSLRSDARVAGVLEAEISLQFLDQLVDGIRVGATGRVLVVDREGNVLLSTHGMHPDELAAFRKGFPWSQAFLAETGGLAYPATHEGPRFLASFRTLPSSTRKGYDAAAMLEAVTLKLTSAAPVPTVRRDEVPDWLVVVQQDIEEGLAVAQRMRANVVLLVGIGLVGLALIGKLWWDSLRA